MSFYRCFKDGRMQRHDPETGEFVDCDPDEPRTRIRKHDEKGNLIEGMFVLPAEMLTEVVFAGTMDVFCLSGEEHGR